MENGDGECAPASRNTQLFTRTSYVDSDDREEAIVCELLLEYNGFAQIADEFHSHPGAANKMSTPRMGARRRQNEQNCPLEMDDNAIAVSVCSVVDGL